MVSSNSKVGYTYYIVQPYVTKKALQTPTFDNVFKIFNPSITRSGSAILMVRY